MKSNFKVRDDGTQGNAQTVSRKIWRFTDDIHPSHVHPIKPFASSGEQKQLIINHGISLHLALDLMIRRGFNLSVIIYDSYSVEIVEKFWNCNFSNDLEV